MKRAGRPRVVREVDDIHTIQKNGPPTGRFGPAADGTFKCVSQSQFTIKPASLKTDAGKIFVASDVRWDIRRELRALLFEFKNNAWFPTKVSDKKAGNETADWKLDDSTNIDEDLTHWSGSANAHLYTSDRPGYVNQPAANVITVLYSHNFREWVRVRFNEGPNGGTSTFFERCSESNYWHALRTLTRVTTGTWREAAGFANDCGPGIDSWGKLPPFFDAKLPRITTETLNNGTKGIAYTATIEATKATAFPNSAVSFHVVDGMLPDGLLLNQTTGVISGTPTRPGTFKFLVDARNSETGQSNLFVDIKQFTISITSP